MIVWLRHFLGWVFSALRSREDLILENLAFHAKRPRRRLPCSAPVVLGCVAKGLGWMETASRRGYPKGLPAAITYQMAMLRQQQSRAH
jgi:hypothetical protein